jgi:uncharacterized protein (DUF1330 family)
MPAYCIAVADVKDPQQYQEYGKLAPAAVAQYGGRYLARGAIAEKFEGALDGNRVVIIEFPDLEMAKAFWHSPEYQAAREKRLFAADFTMVAVPGV